MAKNGLLVGSPSRAGLKVIAALGAAVITCGSALALAPPAFAEGSVLSPETLITLKATPAVQIVLAEFSAKVTIPSWDIDKPAWTAEATDTGSVQGVVNAVAANPSKFFVPAATSRTKNASATFQGSGFFVTPDGYLVTNAHLAAPSEAELKVELAKGVLKQIQNADISSIVNNAGTDVFTAAQLKVLAKAVASLDEKSMKVSDVVKKFSVAVGVGIPGLSTGAKTIPADLTVAGEPAPGKDVAILKVEASNLITVPLGDDTALNVADKVYVVGYPGAAEISQTSMTTPALASGAVSARKTLDNGLSVIQTDAATTHGNSGGPVLDANGKVVGIATFGSVDPTTGSEFAGINFFYPVSLVKEFLTRANVTPAEGVTTQKWSQALTAYDKNYYSEALPLFQSVNELVPGAPLVQEYLKKTQTAIAEGRDQTPKGIFGLPMWLFALIGVVLAGVVVAIVLLVMRGRKSGGQPAVATAGAPSVYTPAPMGDPVAMAAPPVAMAAPPVAMPNPPPPAVATPALPPDPPHVAPATPAVSIARFCAECGAAHEADAHFCPECGHKF